MITVGTMCRVKEVPWSDYYLRNGLKEPMHSSVQPVVQIGAALTPYLGYVQLAFPMWWWKIEELEVVP